MSGNAPHQELLRKPPLLAGLAGRPARDPLPKDEGGEHDSCPAFGYLRGTRDRALAVEFRFRDGNSDWLSYPLLASWRYDPSVGLLLKFTADLVTLVLVRGSNLDAPVGAGGANLTDAGFQRHRVLWVREMDEGELRRTGEGGPTVDGIEVAEFESQAELRAWVGATAPTFLR